MRDQGPSQLVTDFCKCFTQRFYAPHSLPLEDNPSPVCSLLPPPHLYPPVPTSPLPNCSTVETLAAEQDPLLFRRKYQ